MQQIHDMSVNIINHAMSFLGVRYRWGGNTRETGLDCSGLVRLVFAETVGRILPRRSVEMSFEGVSISRRDVKPGDLVFFNTRGFAFSHVGIYVGEDKFIHAPRTGTTVRVESMKSSYWTERFNGVRRILSPDISINSLFIPFENHGAGTSPEDLEEALSNEIEERAAMLFSE
jgi:cell wall-associated NlpC family hydrolase